MIERTGIVENLPAEEYHRGPPDELAFSLSKKMLESPLHCKYAIDNPDTTDTPSKLFGRAWHSMLLDPPEEFAARFAFMPEGMKRQGKKEDHPYQVFLREHPGKDILSHANKLELDAMREGLMRTHVIKHLVADIRTEVSAFWIDPLTGVKCRARGDFLHDGHLMLGDLKSCSTGLDSNAVARTVASYRYNAQASWYTDGFRACGVDVRNFIFIFQESEPPYAARLVRVPELAGDGSPNPDFEHGRHLNRLARERFADCLATDTWPGYPEEVLDIELPPWAKRMGI